ncbi:MAG: hypothetical protein NDI77_04865 [Geobacteraceae bacterium]|nr:hypothetical protein [Geobacteraceae bacterium]
MKKYRLQLAALITAALTAASAAGAQEIVSRETSGQANVGGNGQPTVNGNGEVRDITKELLVGPGSINISAIKDIHMSFGGQIRVIPTMEKNYDFGMEDTATSNFLSFLPAANQLGKAFFKNHANEAGGVNKSYIRSEDRLYFNALPTDRAWSFYAALEFDRALDTETVDERGGKKGGSNFGLERLHGTMALPFLPFNARLHAGWDVWGIDYGEAAGLVYGDDNPGLWLTGDKGPVNFNVGYFKLGENNFQNSITDLKAVNNSSSRDRDLLAGYVDHKINDDHKVRLFYAYDQLRNISTKDLLGVLTGGAVPGTGINKSATAPNPKTDSHHIGGYYVGNFGAVELFGEGVYQFGEAKGTGLGGSQENMDISAYALSGDVAVDLKNYVGFSLKPHLGIMYTSGDDNAGDNKLGGYQGVDNAQRFSNRWGGENTIIGDTNLVLGSMLYGYLPELYGNGTPVATGGLQNTVGLGAGRGDNPGLTMLSYGITVTPRKFIIFKTNANSFWWNEDIKVSSFKTPATSTTVKSGYVGSEWDNELTIALSKNTFIKGQVSLFFPGEVIANTTTALGATGDKTASRLALELIWNF